MKQRDHQWRQARLGDVTASRFKDVLTPPRTKAAREAGQWSRTAEGYMEEKLAELIHCQPADVWRADATDWGTANEPNAFEASIPVIEERFGEKLSLPVDDFAYIHHPTEPHIGCSPDGIIGDEGLGEIKCYYNGAKWIAAKRKLDAIERRMADVSRTPAVEKMRAEVLLPPEHKPQVQGQLWVSERKWCAFCVFDPRVAASGLDRLLVVKVERDDEYIDNILAPKVIEFRDWLLSEYHALLGKDAAPF